MCVITDIPDSNWEHVSVWLCIYNVSLLTHVKAWRVTFISDSNTNSVGRAIVLWHYTNTVQEQRNPLLRVFAVYLRQHLAISSHQAVCLSLHSWIRGKEIHTNKARCSYQLPPYINTLKSASITTVFWCIVCALLNSTSAVDAGSRESRVPYHFPTFRLTLTRLVIGYVLEVGSFSYMYVYYVYLV